MNKDKAESLFLLAEMKKYSTSYFKKDVKSTFTCCSDDRDRTKNSKQENENIEEDLLIPFAQKLFINLDSRNNHDTQNFQESNDSLLQDDSELNNKNRRYTSTWTLDEDTVLINFLSSSRKRKKWFKIARILGNKTPIQCAFRFKRLKKNKVSLKNETDNLAHKKDNYDILCNSSYKSLKRSWTTNVSTKVRTNSKFLKKSNTCKVKSNLKINEQFNDIEPKIEHINNNLLFFPARPSISSSQWTFQEDVMNTDSLEISKPIFKNNLDALDLMILDNDYSQKFDQNKINNNNQCILYLIIFSKRKHYEKRL